MKVETKEFNMMAPFSLTEKDATIVGDENVITIAGYANYTGLDASGKTYIDIVGDLLSVDGIDLSVWASNPVILLGHNRDQVIGKGTRVEKRADGLFIECELHRSAMDEKDWYRLKSGLTCHYSIGFRTQDAMFKEVDGKEVYFITKSLLLECSCVNIPANSMSSFERIKELTDKETNEEIIMTNIKVKRADLLSVKDLEAFKSLGGNEAEEVEISVATFLKNLVAQEVASALEAKEKESKELQEKEAQELKEKEAAELAEKEAAEQEAADKAKLEEEKQLADELAEVKSLVETLKTALAAEEK